MTDAELSNLESLAKAATPGPWEYLPHNSKDAWVITSYQNPECEEYICSIAHAFGNIQEKRNKDGLYITAANPTTILELIAELRQTKADLQRIKIEYMTLSWENRSICERFGLIRKEAT